MRIGLAVVFLLDFFQSCCLNLMHITTLMLVLFVLLTLKFSNYLLLNRRVSLRSYSDIIFHRIWRRHSFQCIPSLPFRLGDHLPNSRLLSIAVSKGCLFIKAVELQFDLIRDKLLALCYKFFGEFKDLYE